MAYDAFGLSIRKRAGSAVEGLPPTPLTLSTAAVPRSFGPAGLPTPPLSAGGRLFPSSSSSLSISTTASGGPPTPGAGSSPAARFLSAFGSPSSQLIATEPEPDAPGQLVPGHAHLTLGALLGSGAGTVVRLASSTSGPACAVKIVRLPPPGAPHAARTRTRLARERALWAALAHEHVLPLFGATQARGRAWFVTLPCAAGTLADAAAGSPALAGPLGRQTAAGLRYLHERGVVHRDIKLENVLVDDAGQARIADFGLAVQLRDGGASESESDASSDEDAPPPSGALAQRRQTTLAAHPSLVRHRTASTLAMSRTSSLSAQRGARERARHVPGSLPYAAPELLRAAPPPPARAQDVWALGCVLHALAAGGALPFEDAFEPRLVVKIQHAAYVPPEGIVEDAAKLLTACFERDPAMRCTVADIDDAGWAPDAGAAAPVDIPPAAASAPVDIPPTGVAEARGGVDNAPPLLRKNMSGRELAGRWPGAADAAVSAPVAIPHVDSLALLGGFAAAAPPLAHEGFFERARRPTVDVGGAGWKTSASLDVPPAACLGTDSPRRSTSVVRGRAACPAPRAGVSTSRSASGSAPPRTPRSRSIEHPLLRRSKGSAPHDVADLPEEAEGETEEEDMHALASVAVSPDTARGRWGGRAGGSVPPPPAGEGKAWGRARSATQAGV